MNLKIGRNDPCPCGSGKKYKKCCMQDIEESHKDSGPWVDKEGMYFVGNGVQPSQEERERMTIEYQMKIKKSPIWEMMVKEYGEDKAEEMLKEFQVQVK